MGKEDVSAKKRRKINTSTASETSKQVPVDVYKVIILFVFCTDDYKQVV